MAGIPNFGALNIGDEILSGKRQDKTFSRKDESYTKDIVLT